MIGENRSCPKGHNTEGAFSNNNDHRLGNIDLGLKIERTKGRIVTMRSEKFALEWRRGNRPIITP